MKTQNLWIYGSWVLLVTLIMMGLTPALHAQEENVPRIASIALRVDTREIDRLWTELVTLLTHDDLKGALRKLEELDLQKVKSGFKNLPAQSIVLVKYAQILKEQKRVADAITVAEAAKRLSPDVAPVYFALAKLRLAENMTNLYGFAREMFFGIVTHYQDIGTIAVSANNILSILLVSCVVAGTVFVLFSFIYYRQAIFYYYFKQLLSLPLPMFFANILGWVLIGVITLALGVFWGVLFLAVSLIVHVEKASQWILNLFLLFGSLLAVLLLAISTTFTQFDDDYFHALRELSFGTYSAKTVAVLQEQLQKEPRDAYAMFGLAYIASHSGYEQEAIAAYEELPGSYPDRAIAKNNIGTLYHQQFLQARSQKHTQKANEAYSNAEDAYSSAIGSAPRMFESRYNIGQLLLSDFQQSEDAEAQLSTARKFDITRFTQQSSYLEYGMVTIDASISLVALLKKMIEPSAYTAGLTLARQLWSSGSRFDNPWYFSAVSFLFLIVSALLGPSKSSPKKVTYCQMCGDPFTVKQRKKKRVRRRLDDEEGQRKKTRKDSQSFCTQCTYIFKKKTTVKPEKRAQKINQIQMRQRLRGLIAKVGSLVFPGGGQIYYGYSIKGIFLALGFSVGLSLLALKVLGKVLLVVEGYTGISFFTIGVSLALLGVAYLLNIFDILKLSPKNQ